MPVRWPPAGVGSVDPATGAGEIDEHEMLGALLLVGEEVFFEGNVLGVRRAALAGAGNGTDLH